MLTCACTVFGMSKRGIHQPQSGQSGHDRVESDEASHGGQGGFYGGQLMHGQVPHLTAHSAGISSFRDMGVSQSIHEFPRFPVPNAPMMNGTPVAESVPLEAMSPNDRYGISGLMSLMRPDPMHPFSFARGQDLTNLQLDIEEPGDASLWKTFSSPWPETSTMPIEHDFEVPSCYKVENVPPLLGKISSLTEESLFYAFYSLVGDVYQECAAQEL